MTTRLSIEEARRKGLVHYLGGFTRPVIYAHRRDLGTSSIQLKGFWLVHDQHPDPLFRYEALGSTRSQAERYLLQMSVVVVWSYSLRDVRDFAAELASEEDPPDPRSPGALGALEDIVTNLLPGISRSRAIECFDAVIGA